MRAIPLTLLVGAALIVSACSDRTDPSGGGGGGGGNDDDPPPATAGVNVQDNQFVAATVRVRSGGTIRWTWQGSNPHNVTFAGGPASSTQTEGSFERTFATAGSFSYLCTVHGQSMSGTVTVVAADETEE